MRKIKYIIIVALLILCTIFYAKYDQKLKANNYLVLSLSKDINLLSPVISDLDILLDYRDEINEYSYDFKLRNIIDKYKDLDQKYSDYIFLNESEFKMTLAYSMKRLSKSKNSTIELVRHYKLIRDLILRFALGFILVVLLIEVINFRIFNKKILFYLDKLENKNYDFKVKKSTPYYFNIILDKIDTMKLKFNNIESAIDSALVGNGLTETLESLFFNENFNEYIHFDRIGFAVIDGDRVVSKFGLSKYKNIKLHQGYSQLLDNTSLKEIAETKEIRIINDLPAYLQEHKDSESTSLIVDEGYKSNLTTPIINHKGEVGGFLLFSSSKLNGFDMSDANKINTISNILSSTFSKNMLIDDLITNIVLGFVNLVEGRDPETSNHLSRMSLYAKIIAETLVYDSKYDFSDSTKIGEIFSFAPLHDIGKVGIPDKILLKPGRLTDDEMTIMKEHSMIGSNVIQELQNNLSKYNMNFFTTAKNIAQCHHERWDGEGYPLGVSGESIPIEARIVTVADVFDALSSKRVYKEAFSFEKSLEIIKSGSGKAFDPMVVNAFLDSLDKITNVYSRLKEV